MRYSVQCHRSIVYKVQSIELHWRSIWEKRWASTFRHYDDFVAGINIADPDLSSSSVPIEGSSLTFRKAT